MGTAERHAKVERFIALDALGLVIDEIGETLAGEFERLRDGDLNFELGQATATFTADLFDELWPTEADVESPEHQMASTRVLLDKAAALLYLTSVGTQQRLREKAFEMLRGVGLELREHPWVSA